MSHPCPHCPHRDPVACCWCGEVQPSARKARPTSSRKAKRDGARYIREFVKGTYSYDSPNVWVCSHCGVEGVWGEGWMWFGSLMDLDEAKVREILCPQCSEGVEAVDDDVA